MHRKKLKKSTKIKWPIEITVFGRPKPQGRGRAFAFYSKSKKRHSAAVRKDDKDVWNEGALKLQFIQAKRQHGLIDPLEGPVLLTVVAVFAKPKSHIRKRKPETSRRKLHTSVPDADNIMKAIKDAGNKVLWKDDSQVAPVGPFKIYGAVGEEACTIVHFKPTTYEKLRKRIEKLAGKEPDTC